LYNNRPKKRESALGRDRRGHDAMLVMAPFWNHIRRASRTAAAGDRFCVPRAAYSRSSADLRR